MPRISILMPSLNRAEFIGEALDSIYAQGVDDVQVVVADGGSTDGTLEVLERYPMATVLAGPDRGLYDALNKAFAASTGTLIGHLNTDDLFLPGALKSVLDAFATSPEVEMVSGGAELAQRSVDGMWRVVQSFPSEVFAALNWERVCKGPILTNARFYRRNIFDKCGPFDTRYKIVADRAFLMNVLQVQPESRFVSQCLMQYRQHSGSLTFTDDPDAQWRSIKERIRLAREQLVLAEHDTTKAQSCANWGRHEAVLGVILALRKRSPTVLLSALEMGRSFGSGWRRYLATSLVALGRSRVRRAFQGR